MDSSTGDKVRENRLRRMAERQGLVLEKCRRRDPRALGYGMYRLSDASTRGLIFSSSIPDDGYSLDLEEVEHYLAGENGG